MIKKFVFLFLLITLSAAALLQAQELTEISEITSENTYYGTGYEFAGGEIVFNTDNSKLIINQGKENEIVIEGNSGIKISPLGKISVAESGAEFSLNGNSFANIKSGDIEFNTNTGEITKADFYTNENIGNYNINENKFNVPANSRFFYDSKEKKFYLENDAEILDAKDVQISGIKNAVLNYKGNSISGNLNFDETGNTFVKIGEQAEINGVLIKNSGNKLYGEEANLPVFFNKNVAETSGKTEYAVIDSANNFFSFQEQYTGQKLANRQIQIEFSKNNYLFGDLMDDDDYVAVSEGSSSPGYLEIIRKPGSPAIVKSWGLNSKGEKIISEGDVVFQQGARNFIFSGEEVSLSHANSFPKGKTGTVQMLFKTGDSRLVGIVVEDKFNKPLIAWIEKEKYSELGATGQGYLSGEQEISEALYNKIKALSISEAELAKIENIIKEPKFQDSLKKSRFADKELKDIYDNKQTGLKEIIKNNPNGISFDDLDKKLLRKGDASKIKNLIKAKIEAYYVYYGPNSNQIQRVLGPNELTLLNNCMQSGGNFADCFDTSYNFFGPKTEKCITDPNFCPIIKAAKLYKSSGI